MTSYRLTIWLVIAQTIVLIVLFLYVLGTARLRTTDSFLLLPVLAATAALWLKSNLLRYGGGVFSLLYGFILLYGQIEYLPSASLSKLQIIVVGIFILLAGLYLSTGTLLVFSKSFGNEFVRLRNLQPRYMAHVRTAVVVVMCAGFIFIVFQDTIYLLPRLFQ